MAMTTCRECKASISTKAKSCPQCGAVIRRTALFTKFVAGFIGLAVILGVWNSVEKSRRDDATAAAERARRAALTTEQRQQEDAAKVAAAKAQAEAKAVRDAEWDAVQRCQTAAMVTAQWHDPGSVEWPELSRSFRELKGGVYTVQVKARGKNAFNATTFNVFECRIRASDMAPLSVKVIR